MAEKSRTCRNWIVKTNLKIYTTLLCSSSEFRDVLGKIPIATTKKQLLIFQKSFDEKWNLFQIFYDDHLYFSYDIVEFSTSNRAYLYQRNMEVFFDSSKKKDFLFENIYLSVNFLHYQRCYHQESGISLNSMELSGISIILEVTFQFLRKHTYRSEKILASCC